ncbi:MAG: hypothetical protein V1900_03305 [Candidatus Aenigmatarchaeota archaeon]
MPENFSINNAPSSEFSKCTKCGAVTQKMNLDSDGVCIYCRTTGRHTEWQQRADKKLERIENAPKKYMVECPICGKESPLYKDEKKKCSCGMMLKVRNEKAI